MEKLMFKNNVCTPIIVNGIILFDPYQVGKCLNLCDSAVRKAIGNMNDKQAVKLTNSTVKDFHSYVKSPFGKLFLTESGMYKLAFRSNKPEAEDFTNWVADEVLPQIRKTGSYTNDTQLPLPETTYEYHDKTWRGQPVLSTADVSHLTGITNHTVAWFARCHLNAGDSFFLEKKDLIEFKFENPRVNKLANKIHVITRSGFERICKYYGIQIETPKLFIEQKIPVVKMPPTNDGDKEKTKEKAISECTITLGTLEKIRAVLVKTQNTEAVNHIDTAIKYAAWQLSKDLIG